MSINFCFASRSPLTALQLQIQVLERSRGPAERAEATTELLAGVARARRLVEQLLYLSRASAGDNAGVPLVREPVTLRDVAQAVVARWSLEAEHRHIDLGVDAESESSVDGDAAQLEILLGNLVENALRYTRRGGVVDVVAGDFGGLPALRVFDNGPGIVEMERLRVFDRFYRSPEAAVSAEMEPPVALVNVATMLRAEVPVALVRTGTPEAMPSTMTMSTYDVSRVSLRILRKRTMANTAIMPKAVTRLLERTIMTRQTTSGMMISALTKDRE